MLLDVIAEHQPQLLRRVDERVDDEHLLVEALGHEVHLHVRAALHEKRVRLLAHAPDCAEQVFDQDDIMWRDALEGQVMLQRVLVARAGRTERNERRPRHQATFCEACGASISSSSILHVAPISRSNSAAVKSLGRSASRHVTGSARGPRRRGWAASSGSRSRACTARSRGTSQSARRAASRSARRARPGAGGRAPVRSREHQSHSWAERVESLFAVEPRRRIDAGEALRAAARPRHGVLLRSRASSTRPVIRSAPIARLRQAGVHPQILNQRAAAPAHASPAASWRPGRDDLAAC